MKKKDITFTKEIVQAKDQETIPKINKTVHKKKEIFYEQKVFEKLKTMNDTLHAKVENMRSLLILANEKIEESKLKIAKYKTRANLAKEAVMLLARNARDQWLPCGLLKTNKQQAQSPLSDKSRYRGVNVNLCVPVRRVKFNEIYWCLFSVSDPN